MIPRRDYRKSGKAGGGRYGGGGATPFFCKLCGRTVGRKSVSECVDVCKKCRLRK